MKNRLCDFCGKRIESKVNFGSSFGIVCLDNSGDLYSDFDACEECLKRIVEMIANKKMHSGKYEQTE